MSAAERRERQVLVAVVALGLALRVGLALLGAGDDRFTNVDTDSYRTFAAALPGALGDPEDPRARDASLQRSPGYPVVVRLLGGSSGRYGVLVGAQCLLGGLVTVLLVHRLAREVAGPAAGLVAAAVVSVDPVSIGHCLLVGTETVFTALVAVAALGAWRARAAVAEGGRPLPPAVVAGVALGAAALVRPQVTYLLPLVAAGAGLLAVAPRRTGGRAPRGTGLAVGAAVLVTAAAVAGPWVVRTSLVADRPLISTAQGQNVADFGAAAMEAERTGIAWWPEPTDASYARQDRARARFDARYGTDADLPDPVERAARWEEAGWDALAAHPRGALAVAASSVLRGLVGPGDTLLVQAAGPSAPAAVTALARPASILLLALELVLAVGGLASLLLRRRLAAAGLLALPAATYLLTSSGPQMYARFRVPIVPFVAVLAGIGLLALLRRGRAA